MAIISHQQESGMGRCADGLTRWHSRRLHDVYTTLERCTRLRDGYVMGAGGLTRLIMIHSS